MIRPASAMSLMPKHPPATGTGALHVPPGCARQYTDTEVNPTSRPPSARTPFTAPALPSVVSVYAPLPLGIQTAGPSPRPAGAVPPRMPLALTARWRTSVPFPGRGDRCQDPLAACQVQVTACVPPPTYSIPATSTACPAPSVSIDRATPDPDPAPSGSAVPCHAPPTRV